MGEARLAAGAVVKEKSSLRRHAPRSEVAGRVLRAWGFCLPPMREAVNGKAGLQSALSLPPPVGQ